MMHEAKVFPKFSSNYGVCSNSINPKYGPKYGTCPKLSSDYGACSDSIYGHKCAQNGLGNGQYWQMERKLFILMMPNIITHLKVPSKAEKEEKINIDQKMKICPLEVGWTGWHVRAKGHNREGMPDYGQACRHLLQKQTKMLVDK